MDTAYYDELNDVAITPSVQANNTTHTTPHHHDNTHGGAELAQQPPHMVGPAPLW